MNFEFNTYQMRLVDMRPNANQVQLNIYNPADAGHSMAKTLRVAESDSLESIKNNLIESGQLQESIDRAAVIFGE